VLLRGEHEDGEDEFCGQEHFDDCKTVSMGFTERGLMSSIESYKDPARLRCAKTALWKRPVRMGTAPT
jgi:hypothetical protein